MSTGKQNVYGIIFTELRSGEPVPAVDVAVLLTGYPNDYERVSSSLSASLRDPGAGV